MKDNNSTKEQWDYARLSKRASENGGPDAMMRKQGCTCFIIGLLIGIIIGAVAYAVLR